LAGALRAAVRFAGVFRVADFFAAGLLRGRLSRCGLLGGRPFSPAPFFAAVFFAGAFFAGVFLAAVFLADVFFAADFFGRRHLAAFLARFGQADRDRLLRVGHFLAGTSRSSACLLAFVHGRLDLLTVPGRHTLP
jgi:hypothetical protein